MEEVINTTWEIERAPSTLERQKQMRLDILGEAKESPCTCRSGGDWLGMARNVLDNNFINQECFAKAIRDLLRDGRGKYRNILLTGPANCGKTFLLAPLNKIFQCFQNPAATSFAWLGAEEAEILLLNDFRWTSKVCNSKLKLKPSETAYLRCFNVTNDLYYCFVFNFRPLHGVISSFSLRDNQSIFQHQRVILPRTSSYTETHQYSAHHHIRLFSSREGTWTRGKRK